MPAHLLAAGRPTAECPRGAELEEEGGEEKAEVKAQGLQSYSNNLALYPKSHRKLPEQENCVVWYSSVAALLGMGRAATR